MGQAAVDLPDPLESPQAPSDGNADDLLSQLAGDAIDRLLAEADESAIAAAPLEPPATSASAKATELSPTSETPQPGAVPAAEEVTASRATIDAELDSVFASVQPTPAPADQPAASAPADSLAQLDSAIVASAAPLPVDNAVLAPATSAPQAAMVAVPIGPDAAERAALVADLPTELASAASTPPLPIYFKPLVWVNAPFKSIPAPAREAFGKTAILTTVNAVALIVYVLLFRHH